MIPPRTLLILGAGASRPYLFPTARELTNLILGCNENVEMLANMGFDSTRFSRGEHLYVEAEQNIVFKYRYWLADSMEAMGVEKRELEHFQERFYKSQSYSVDAFVADNPVYKPLASLLIAAILLRCEQEDRLDGDWYQIMFNELIDEHGKDFREDALSVITFNYDRSLEMFLFRAFLNRYNLLAAQAWAFVNLVRTIHVYGDFGPLFKRDGSREMGYGATNIRAASQNLRLVSPRVESEHLEDINRLIKRARRIVFLGFGFDRLNLQQIQIPYQGGQKVFASCCGLSSAAKIRAASGLKSGEYPDRGSLDDSKWIKWGERTHTAADFLHNSVAFA